MALEIGYLTLSILMFIIIVLIGNYSIKSEEHVKGKLALLIISLLGWHIFIGWISTTSFIKVLDFPPRFFLITILPLFVFTGIFIYKQRNAAWIQRIPSHWLIFYQTFRIGIETLFVYSVIQEILHPNLTIKGYNYDMIFASSAPVVGFLLSSNKEFYRKLAIVWNYLGLTVIVSIIALFQTTIYFPEMYGDIIPFSTSFLAYPYLLVPAFLMPSAVFVHVLSIVQLSRKEEITLDN